MGPKRGVIRQSSGSTVRIPVLWGEFRWDLESLGKDGEEGVTGRVTVLQREWRDLDLCGR